MVTEFKNLKDYDELFNEGEIRDSFKEIRTALLKKTGANSDQVIVFKKILTALYNRGFDDGVESTSMDLISNFDAGYKKGFEEGEESALKSFDKKSSKKDKSNKKNKEDQNDDQGLISDDLTAAIGSPIEKTTDVTAVNDEVISDPVQLNEQINAEGTANS